MKTLSFHSLRAKHIVLALALLSQLASCLSSPFLARVRNQSAQVATASQPTASKVLGGSDFNAERQTFRGTAAADALQYSVAELAGNTEPDSLTLFFAALFVVAAFVAGRRRFHKLMTDYEREMGERFD